MDHLREGLGDARRLATLDLLGALLVLGEGSRVGVEAELHLEVAERVLLLHVGALGDGATTDRAEDLLHVAGVDDLGQIGLLHDGGGDEEVLLQGRGLGGGAVDLVEGGESRGGPDDQAAKVTTGGELEKVERVHGGSLNTGKVAESSDELLAILIGVVDDEGTTALPVATASELTLTSAELLGLLDLVDISTGTNGPQQSKGSGGLGDGTVSEGGGGNDEGNLRDGGDVVTTGHEESSAGRSSNSRGGSETLLVQVDLLVPLPPDLGGSEHATGSAHVTESSLTGTVSSTTRDTGDTGDGTSSTPGLG